MTFIIFIRRNSFSICPLIPSITLVCVFQLITASFIFSQHPSIFNVFSNFLLTEVMHIWAYVNCSIRLSITSFQTSQDVLPKVDISLKRFRLVSGIELNLCRSDIRAGMLRWRVHVLNIAWHSLPNWTFQVLGVFDLLISGLSSSCAPLEQERNFQFVLFSHFTLILFTVWTSFLIGFRSVCLSLTLRFQFGGCLT